jgi:[acyl-carrier-protein] S-malonyltransferase
MGNCAFLFPGQASQFVGMGRDLCEEFDLARAVFDQADAILGMPLTRLCFEGPEDELRQTNVTQPAVFVHSMAAWQVLVARGGRAACVAGHSLGEYSAIVAAGALEFEVALRLVKRRGELMQESGAARPGTMTAVVGLDEATVEELCSQVAGPEIVVPANYNCPGQLVVSGDPAAVERLGELAAEAGAKRVIPLAVSGAFHSPLMAPAAEEMSALLNSVEFAAPSVPVIPNVTARPTTAPEELRRNLVEQMTQPVRWMESVNQLDQLDVSRAVEVGPGSVLKGLARRISRSLTVQTAGLADEIAAAVVVARNAG